jgi:DNA-binding GntR family transcriptional regulator
MRTERLVDQAYTHIKKLLLDGLVRDQSWFAIDEIAGDLGISRQPVMDAMKRLSLEGFIEIVPQVGCRIKSASPDEVTDFFRLFASSEGLISQLAAERATTEDILQLKLLSAQIGALGGWDGDSSTRAQSYRLLNRQFHAELRRIARSSAVSDIVERLADRSDFYIAQSGTAEFSEHVGPAHAEHERLLLAIERRDPELARQAGESHIAAAAARLHPLS